MTRTATVVDTYELTPRVKGFRLRVPGETFEYEAGQHTTIHFEAGSGEVVRPYTPTNLPGTDELTLADPDRDVAFVGTGTGITPLLAMARQYVAEGTGDAHFLFGEKSEESIIHRGTLNELAAADSNFEVIFSLSDPGWRWTGRVGYVQTHLKELFDDFESRDFYVCGVPQMVVDTKARLRELGAPEERIHSEGWEDGAVSED